MLHHSKTTLRSSPSLHIIRSLPSTRSYSSPPSAPVSVQTIPSILDPTFIIPDKSVIFSGIQPTGAFHLGNYFGAVRNWRDFQTRIRNDHIDSQLLFFVADLHSLTMPQDFKHLANQRAEAFASLMACGIDPDQAIIFFQSEVPEIPKLQWILSCICGMGQLNRMTQWKSKANLRSDADISEELGKVKLGLFTYPVLMAADILTFNATHVPVGGDQSQHMELTRDLAAIFNRATESDYLHAPKTLLTPTMKVLSLKNPEKKMSKSDPDEMSKIFITEDSKSIRKKINKALTDSIEGKLTYDPENRPAVSNLIAILAAAEGKPISEVAKMVEDFSKGELKEAVSQSVVRELSEPAERFGELMKDVETLDRISRRGSERAREIASRNLQEVSKLTGMGYW
ncbi:DEKNAAC105272 [Brettanomyces naardenensis]|uniref:tryptophan--tRNA ligase n=1 Tax=Brettanomyces naardenensis TaxID=13370 RepID=A0A448YSU8_BRENA|nr:DEKNAAC105272 [Brettanomyces naardenensis]